MFIVLNEHKVFFFTLTLYMPLLLDWFIQMYFSGHFIHVTCTCMFFMFLMILGLLMNNLLNFHQNVMTNSLINILNIRI